MICPILERERLNVRIRERLDDNRDRDRHRWQPGQTGRRRWFGQGAIRDAVPVHRDIEFGDFVHMVTKATDGLTGNFLT